MKIDLPRKRKKRFKKELKKFLIWKVHVAYQMALVKHFVDSIPFYDQSSFSNGGVFINSSPGEEIIEPDKQRKNELMRILKPQK